MSTVYDTTTQSYKAVSGTSGSNVSMNGDFSIDAILYSIELLENKVRDSYNEYSVEQSSNWFKSANESLEDKKESANKKRMKSIMDGAFAAGGLMVTSSTLCTSWFEHGFKKTNRDNYKTGINELDSLNKQFKNAGSKSEKDLIERDIKDFETAFKAKNGYALEDGAKHKGMLAFSQNAQLVSTMLTSIGEFASTKKVAGASSAERNAEMHDNFKELYKKDADSFVSEARSTSSKGIEGVQSIISEVSKARDAIASNT